MKIKYKISFHIAIFLILLITYFITGFMYESIMMETSDYGKIINATIIGLAEIFQFPINYLFNLKSTLANFMGIFLNLNFYAVIIYFLTKLFFRKKSIS